MGNLAGWKLTNAETGKTVHPGVELLDHRGTEWRIDGVTQAPEGASSGKILAVRTVLLPDVARMGEQRREFYPTVFGLSIVKDVPEDEQRLFAQLTEDMEDTADETAKELTVDSINHMVEEHGMEPAQVIAMACSNYLAEHLANAMGMAIQVAMEYGRRQALRDSAGN